MVNGQFNDLVGYFKSHTHLGGIVDGAFKDCKNLKEIRLFYYAQDGDDRWQVLGPTDIIPATTSSASRRRPHPSITI